jgi:hypothetical protein
MEFFSTFPKLKVFFGGKTEIKEFFCGDYTKMYVDKCVVIARQRGPAWNGEPPPEQGGSRSCPRGGAGPGRNAPGPDALTGPRRCFTQTSVTGVRDFLARRLF